MDPTIRSGIGSPVVPPGRGTVEYRDLLPAARLDHVPVGTDLADHVDPLFLSLVKPGRIERVVGHGDDRGPLRQGPKIRR